MAQFTLPGGNRQWGEIAVESITIDPPSATLTVDQTTVKTQLFKAIGDSIQAVLGIPYELNPTPDFFANRRERAFTGPFRNNWFPDYPLNENYLAPVYASGNAEEGNTNFGYYSADFEAAIAEGDGAATLDEAVTAY